MDYGKCFIPDSRLWVWGIKGEKLLRLPAEEFALSERGWRMNWFWESDTGAVGEMLLAGQLKTIVIKCTENQKDY